MESEYSVDPVKAALDGVQWWGTLGPDEQDLLRITYSQLPNDYNMLAFMAATNCPVITSTADSGMPYRLTPSGPLHDLLSRA